MPARHPLEIVDGSVLPDPLPGDGPKPPPSPPLTMPVRRVKRFHGEVALSEPRRPIPELTKIVDEVVGRLAQQSEVRLSVTLQIEAEHTAEAGLPDDTVRAISENAKPFASRTSAGTRSRRLRVRDSAATGA